MKLYYALIYPFLTYGILIWGNTCETTLKAIFILQRKAVCIITFSKLDSHSSPLFKSLGLIYPFLTYGILIWGNTYEATLKPIFILQKKAVCIITFSKLDSHSSPLFKSLGLIKFFDIVLFQIAILMFKFHNNVLPAAFHFF